MKRFAAGRYIAAWLLTLGSLPWAWGWVLIYPMSVGQVHWTSTLSLLGALLTLFGLTWGVRRPLRDERWAKWGLRLLALVWITTMTVIVFVMTKPSISQVALAGLFVPATLWMPWLAWLGYRGNVPRWKQFVLGVLLALMVPFVILVRVERLSGDNPPFFAWRFADPRTYAGATGEKLNPLAAPLKPIGPDDSPQYLGPTRDGVYANAKLADWAAAPPREVWRRPVGLGWSSFAIVDGCCFTQEQRDEQECIVCYRLSDGAMIWFHAENGRFQSSMGGDGPRSTPTIHDGRLYAISPRGMLRCLDASTGQLLWGTNIIKDCGGPNLMHGLCAAPLIDGDRLIVVPPAENGPCLAAYHRETGKLLWQSGTYRASYSSPVLWTYEGQPQILLFVEAGLIGFDAGTGRQLWHFPWTNSDRINVSQPIPDVEAGRVLITTGYGAGSALVTIHREPPDRWTTSHWWKSKVMKTKFTTAVPYQGHAYGLDDGILACIDAGTGKLRWKGERDRHGQVIRAGDRLIVQLESGEIALVDASPTAFKELGRVRGLRGEDGAEHTTWNVPALSGRYLVIRNFREAVCYELQSR